MCSTLCNPIVCSLPGSPVDGMFQARILEWVAISFSRESTQPGIKPVSPALAGVFFPTEPSRKPLPFHQPQFSCSVMSDSLQPHALWHTRLPCPSPTPGACSLKSIESVTPSNHLILCCPLLLLPSILPSIRVFSIESALHIRWPKYCSFSFSINPSNNTQG